MKRFINNNFIQSSIGLFFNKSGVVLSLILASNFLSLNDYVDFTFFLFEVGIFSGVVGTSLSLTANRYSYRTKLIYSLWILIVLSAVISSLFYFGYSFFWGKQNSYGYTVLVEILYIFFMIYYTSMNGIYYGQNKFKKYTNVSIFCGVSSILLGSTVIIFHSYQLLILLLMIPYFLYFVWSSINILTKNKIISLYFIKKAVNKIFFPNLFSGLLFQPVIYFSANLILDYSTEIELVAYSVANQIRMVLLSFSVITGSVFLSKLINTKNSKETNFENLQISFYPMVMFLSLIIIFKDLIFYVFGSLDLTLFSYNILVLGIAAIISSINSAVSRHYIVKEKGKIGILNNLTWLISYLIFCVFFIKSYGSIGASLSFLFASLVQFLVWLPFNLKFGFLELNFFNINFLLTIILFSGFSITIFKFESKFISTFILFFEFWFIIDKVFGFKLSRKLWDKK